MDRDRVNLCDTIRREGYGVERINLPWFHTLAQALAYVLNSTETTDSFQVALNAGTARQYAMSLLNPPLSLSVSRAATWSFNEAVDSFTNELASQNQDRTELLAKWRNLVSRAETLNILLSNELQTLATYYAAKKGIYDTADLIEKADETLPTSTLENVSEEVHREIRDAGRCLAFDNHTAVGFHIMRAVESVLYDYTHAICPDGKIRRSQNWGHYLNLLRTSPDTDVKEVVALLQQLKDRHRNLIMHPEIVLSEDDALRLFETGKTSIMAMADRL